MGTSKGVLLSGVALIIGFYTVGIKKTDRMTAEMAETRANELQSENIAQSGVRLAINELVVSNFATNSSKSLDLLGGTISYTITSSSGSAHITSTGQFSGRTVKVIADVQQTPTQPTKSRGNMWQISKMYVQPS